MCDFCDYAEAPPSLTQLILQDLLFLLHDDENMDILLGSFGWPSWVLEVLFQERAWRLRHSASIFASSASKFRSNSEIVGMMPSSASASSSSSPSTATPSVVEEDSGAENSESQSAAAAAAAATAASQRSQAMMHRFQQSDAILDMSLKLLSLLLFRGLRTRPLGWCYFADTLAFLVLLGEQRSVSDGLMVAGALLRDIVIQVKRTAETEDVDQVTWIA